MQFAQALADCTAVHMPLPPVGITHAWYEFHAFVKPEGFAEGWSRDCILREIAALAYSAVLGSFSKISLERCYNLL